MPLKHARPVSGRYSGATDRFTVELRVDVDGPRPTRRLSADYFRGGRYFGSMRVDAPQIAFGAGVVKIVGKARFSPPAPIAAVRVTIPRGPSGTPPEPVKLSHLTADGSVFSTYVCEFDAPGFRRVELQETVQQGVTPCSSYDTARLPSAGPRRRLSLRDAYAEAGIEFVGDHPANVVEGANKADTWSDAELQAAMQLHFGRLDEKPQWAIWLLHAWAHDDPVLCGLMFDRSGRHRQGCAVFYASMAGTDAETQRKQLYTCVHELGHGFNLLHSWQKSLARPPVPPRPASSSWMNYAKRFPGGPARFWPQFQFQFDEPELVHLRHGFQDDVIMGGNPFTGGAASLRSGASDERASATLRMRIGAPACFGVGVPVTMAIELAATSAHGVPVADVIGPRAENVDVAIRGPDGRQTRFVPLLVHCHGDVATMLTPQDGPRRDFAFVHYGKHGFAFDGPGRYAIRARHSALDGTVVHSNVLSIEVAAPRTREDRAVSRLVCGNDDIGALMSLAGSAAPVFDGANRTLDEIVERHPSTDAALIARVVRAAGLARPFKLLVPGATRVQTRPADPARAAALIDPVIDLSAVDGAMPGTRPGVPPAVTSYVNSRRMEIATAIATPQMAAQAIDVKPPLQRPRDPGPAPTLEPTKGPEEPPPPPQRGYGYGRGA